MVADSSRVASVADIVIAMRRKVGAIIAVILIGCAIVFLEGVLRPRHRSPSENEASAIGGLRTIDTAQTIFREGDKEGDGTLDYGSLLELSNATLVDPALGSGERNGYRFEVRSGGEYAWFAVANPVESGVTGHRSFCANHEDVCDASRPLSLAEGGAACALPRDVVPIDDRRARQQREREAGR
jgi:hypothetical protein